VLEEAGDELHGIEGTALGPSGPAVAIAESDLSVLEALQAAVGEGDAEEVAG
jgi:hypothetical protein